jgi:uncharacterized membrane protein
MELSAKIITLFIAVFLTGLSAGFFYAWEVSVIQGTRLVADKTYLETMQSINRAILNPAFMIVFMGTLFLLAGSSYLQYRHGVNLSFWFMLSAAIVYVVGTFGVTVGGNVPLNDALDALNLNQLDAEGMKSFRASYEGKWNQLHTIRTVFAMVSFVLSLLAVFVGRPNY